MKRIFSIFFCLSLASCALAPALTGCKSSPVLLAYQSADAVISSADVAIAAWSDYVISERKKINKLPVMDRGSMQADLLRKEGRVAIAWGQYQTAMQSAEAAVGIAFNNRQRLPETVEQSAAALVAIVKELTR